MAPKAKSAPKSDKAKEQEIYDKADGILAQFDRAYIFKNKTCREFPKFDDLEISSGAILGKGGFSDVHEVLEIQLTEEQGKSQQQQPADSETSSKPSAPLPLPAEKGAEEPHYEVSTAREFMVKHGIRYESARYAIKRLKNELDQVERARGAIDLAIEIKCLSAISHPNIVKMRGISDTPRLSVDTFLLMDRLYGTLDDKFENWEQIKAMNQGCCGISKNNPVMNDLLKERLLIAYDLTSALNYLHGLHLIYRDLKPENIGFDIRGDVKLFDFGLAKSLDKSNKAKGGRYGYNLTVRTGSIPYMAPEVALGRPYGKEADVFSFAILLWEILSLDWAFNGFTTQEYFFRVAKNNERLLINKGGSWPIILRTIVREAWDKDPKKRPSMKRIGTLIRGDLEDMSSDAAVINRTEHMLNKSQRSTRILMMNGSRHMDGSRHRDRSGRQMFVDGDLCGNASGKIESLK